MTLTYCYDNDAKHKVKLAQARFVRAVAKLLPDFKVEFSFNPGGIAVWGETMVKASHAGEPKVEACLSKDFSYIRQWAGGSASGRNHSITLNDPQKFADMLRSLAAQPFRRF
jgi:hypothetical protein